MNHLHFCRTLFLLFIISLNFSLSFAAVSCDSTSSLSVVVGYGGNNTNCQLPCNGQVYGNPSGGVTPYTYLWNNGVTTQNQIGVCPGIYILTVTDANGCTAASQHEVWGKIPGLTATAQAFDNQNCTTPCNGSATVNVTGGSGSIQSYLWSNGSNSMNPFELCPGTYGVTVTDNQGCTATSSANVGGATPGNPVSVSASIVPASACATPNGKIRLTVSGGTPAYSYSWSTGATTDSLVAGVGNYSVTVTDASGCSTSDNYTITASGVFLTVSSVSIKGTCPNASVGSIKVTTTGGTAPYTYNWSNGATGDSITGLPVGTYTVSVTDASGCFNTVPYSFTVNHAVISVSGVTFPTSACNTSTGKIKLSGIGGGTAPYSILWNTGATTDSLVNIGVGNYSVTVTDVNGCSKSDTFTVSATGVFLTVTSTSITQTTCTESSDGTIKVTTTGGTAPYTYNWSNGATGDSITGLPVGTYSVSVTDAGGCFNTLPYSFTVTSIRTITISGGAHPSVCGANNGKIYASGDGGTAPYSLVWSTGETTDSIFNLAPGNYTVTGTDANGCTAEQTFEIISNNATIHAYGSVMKDDTCGAGTGYISLNIQGNGTAPYTYSWTGPNAFTSTETFISGLHEGDYFVTITDANGCTGTNGIHLYNITSTIYAYGGVMKDDTCGAGTGYISLNIQGNGTAPYTYSWTGPDGFTSTETFISGLHEGDYFVTVTDAHGCTGTNGIHLYNLTSTIYAYGGVMKDDTCGAGTGYISLNIQGNGTAPYTYNWTGPNGFTSTDAGISGLFEGDYFVTVTDSRGCTGTNGIHVHNIISTIHAYLGAFSEDTCGKNTGSISLNIQGNGTPPYTYEWTGSNGFASTQAAITGLATGDYFVTVTDAHGCTGMNGIRVRAIAAPLDILPGGGLLVPTCVDGNNGSIQPNVTAGTPPYVYSWTGPNNFTASTKDISNLYAGLYHISVTDAHGCYDSDTFRVNSFVVDILPGGCVFNRSCPEGASGHLSPTINAGTAPYTFSWTGPNGFTSNLQDLVRISPGDYTLTITDSKNCRDSHTWNIPSEALDILPGGYVTNGSCAGFSRGFIVPTLRQNTGRRPFTYNWTGPNAFTSRDSAIFQLRAGDYPLTITDANGCQDSHTYNVTEYPAPNVNVTTQPAHCTGLNGTATASGFHTQPNFYTTYTYAWSHGQTGANATGMGPGNYTVTVTDGNSCSASRNFTLGSVIDSIYHGGAETWYDSCNAGRGRCLLRHGITGGTPPYQIGWSNGGSGYEITGLFAGVYTATISDANGCSATKDFNLLNHNFSLTTNISTFTHPDTCNGGYGACGVSNVMGRPPFTYLWSDGEITASISGKEVGSYTITITDANTCSGTHTFTIQNFTPTFNIHLEGGNVPVECEAATAFITPIVDDITFTYQSPVKYLLIMDLEWSSGSRDTVLRNVGPGTYSVTMTEPHGCTATASYTVQSNNVPLSVTAYNAGPIPCNGGNTTIAAIVGNQSPGTPPYAYRWSNGETRDSIRVNAAGNYTVTVSDANKCEGATNLTVLAQQNTVVINPTITQPKCHGEKGFISINPAGGLTPHNASWSNGSTSWNLFNLDAGTYSVTVTNGSNCNSTGSYTINAAPAELTVDVVEDSFNCQGVTHFHANVAGGTTPYTFDWTPGAHQDGNDPRFRFSTASNLTFTCTVTDTNNCTAVDSFMQTKTGLNYVIITGDTCPQGGVMRAEPQNGVAPFTYRWSTGATTQSLNYTGTGIYYVTVTDANNCSVIADKFIRQLAFGHTSTATTCEGAHDGAIDMVVHNNGIPYQIQWTGPNGYTSQQEDISNLYAGMYHFTITYGGGCRMNDSIRVADAIGNFGLYSTPTGTSCEGAHDGSITIQPVLNTTFTVSWTGPNGFTSNQQNIFNLYAGNYNYIIEDTRGCRKTGTINVTDAIGNFGLYSTPTATTCAGGHDGSITIQPVLNTQYTVAWTGPNGFTSAQQNISNLYAGDYNYAIEDTRGCRKTGTINVPDAIGNFSIGYTPTATTCRGAHDGSINLVVYLNHNNYSVQWSGPNGFTSANEDISNLYAGDYSVTITDNNRGCSKVQTGIRVDDAVTRFAYGVTPTATSCRGSHSGAVDLFIYSTRPPFNIQWTGPNGFTSVNEDISGLYSGRYYYRVEDARGCVIQDSAFIEDAVTHFSYGITPHHPSCGTSADGWIDLTVYSSNRPFTINWRGPNGFTSSNEDINSLRAGTYYYTVEDAIGCRISDSTRLASQNGAISLTSTIIQSCRDQNTGGAVIAATGGTSPYTYSWSNGTTGREAFNLDEGQYTCTVTDVNSCSNIIQVGITESSNCVWPGDANSDGLVNNRDILALGHAFNQTGFPRFHPTTDWKGQTCDDWSESFQSGVNHKHADCNGNGTVNSADRDVVTLNYYRAHDKGHMSGTPEDPLLYLVYDGQELTPGSTLKADVYLGTDSLPVTDFYGIIFSIMFDNSVIEEGSVSFDIMDSWIGTPDVNVLGFSTVLFSEGMVEVAITRTTQTDTSGYGKIGTLNMTVRNDFFIEDAFVTWLGFSGVEAESAEENSVPLYHEDTAQIVIVDQSTGLITADEGNIKIYPNPVTEKLYLDISNADVEEVCLMSLFGQCVTLIIHPQVKTVEIATNTLPSGTYLVQLKTQHNTVIRKVVVMK